MRNHSDNVTIIDRAQKLGDENLVACLRHLNQNYTSATLNALAEQFHYSPSQLILESIKKYTKYTFYSAVRRVGFCMRRADALCAAAPIKMYHFYWRLVSVS